MKFNVKRAFKSGLIALTPMALTIAFISWMYSTLENLFSAPIRALLGRKFYFPGLGILFALVLIFAVGSVLNNLFVQKIYEWGEKLLTKIPLVKTLYNSLRDMMNYFKSNEKKMGKVVRVAVGDIHMLGIVTRENFEGVAEGMGKEGEIAVFIPISYQMGGYMLFVPRSRVQQIEMSVEEAMRFAITAGALVQKAAVETKQEDE